MMYYVDRIEKQLCVLQNEKGEIFSVNVSLLPEDAKEGSVLCFDGKSYCLSQNEAERKKMLNLRLRNLKKNKKT